MVSPLNYIKRPSSLKKNAPLLIMCHGYGSDENDLFSFGKVLQDEFFIISLQAPYPLQPYGNAWYAINFDAIDGKWSDDKQALKSVVLISEFIDYAITTYPVNQSNVTLLGFSQGSILSYAVALGYPEKVSQVIALSGYVNKAILPENLDTLALKKLDFFCSHGSVDQVIPVDWARKTPEFLKQFKIPHVYKEYPVGHGVDPQNFHDFKNWLAERI